MVGLRLDPSGSRGTRAGSEESGRLAATIDGSPPTGVVE